MPKKRTSPESSDDEPANKGSDSVFQEDENSKRAKLVSLSDTTLQDLPMELIERILIKVIVMEVQDMKLVKSERKGRADQVIDRLRTVCSQWDSILTTNFFRNELNRTFDAQKTFFRLEILHRCQPRSDISSLTTMKDEIFLLYGRHYRPSDNVALDVYGCNNLAVVKDVIRLPEIWPICIQACSVSNGVYILHRTRSDYIRISRITKDGDHQFTFSEFIIGVRMSNPGPTTLSVAVDGSLLFSRWQGRRQVISIYNVDGSLQRELKMHSAIPAFYPFIPRPNGNLVLVSTGYGRKTTLTEIDMDVTIIRQYQSTLLDTISVFNAGMCGSMMLIDRFNRIELLDSELNLVDVIGPQLTQYEHICESYSGTSHFNLDRNEFVTVVHGPKRYARRLLTIIGCS